MVSALPLRTKQSGFEPCPGTLRCVLTLTVALSTHVYKWVPANLMLEVPLRWTCIPPRGGLQIFVVASCHRNRDKLRPGRPLGLISFTYLLFMCCTKTSVYFNIEAKLSQKSSFQCNFPFNSVLTLKVKYGHTCYFSLLYSLHKQIKKNAYRQADRQDK